MKVTEIRNVSAADISLPAVFQARTAKSSDSKELEPSYRKSLESGASLQWQKDILMEGLSKLENNIQLDDNHPLDRNHSKPIESFKEALIELSLTRLPEFEVNLSGAQANLKVEDIISLFSD